MDSKQASLVKHRLSVQYARVLDSMHAVDNCLISSEIKPVKGADAALLALVGMV